MKIREWCKLKEIKAQIKRIHWLEKEKLAQNSLIVICFMFIMGIYFYASDALIVVIFEMLGLS